MTNEDLPNIDVLQGGGSTLKYHAEEDWARTSQISAATARLLGEKELGRVHRSSAPNETQTLDTAPSHFVDYAHYEMGALWRTTETMTMR